MIPPNAALTSESSSAMHPGSPGLNVTRVSLKEEASARREILELRKETNYASKHVKAADSQLQIVKSEARRPPSRPFPPSPRGEDVSDSVSSSSPRADADPPPLPPHPLHGSSLRDARRRRPSTRRSASVTSSAARWSA